MAPARRTARGTSASPPARGRGFAAYLERRPPGIRVLANDVVELVRSEVPKAEARMNYGCPFFYLAGVPFAYISASNVRVLLGFLRGVDIADPTGLLQGTGRSDVRRAAFRDGTPLPRREARAWVRQAAKLAAREASTVD